MELFPQPHEWPKILWPEISWFEKMIRPIVVYLLLLVVFRLLGKKELGQATLSDLLLIALIANVVQNSMIGEDNSLVGGSFGGLVMILLWYGLNRITSRSEKAERTIEGCPTLLVRDGEMLRENMRKESVAENELFQKLRQEGVQSVSEVRFALMEQDGSISLLKKEDVKDRPDEVPEVWQSAIEQSQIEQSQKEAPET